MLLEKTSLNSIKVLIFKALIDSYCNHVKFGSVNTLLRECNEMKEEIKNPQKCCGIYYIKTMKMYSFRCEKMQQTKILVSEELNKID